MRVHLAPRRPFTFNSRSLVCSASPEASSTRILDRFWQARGVVDGTQRQRLVDIGLEEQDDSAASLFSSAPVSALDALPGVSSTWSMGEIAPMESVALVSRRLMALQRLLGERDDIDLVWMCEREPQLLSGDLADMTQRLVMLRTADGAAGVDVVKLVEAQPRLLVEEGELSLDQEESNEQRQLSWEFGLLGDGDMQWEERLGQLERYKAVHGDAHVGFRDGDESGLERWAAKQRKEYKSGTLTPERTQKLQDLGFEFDGERAEWLRWFNQLCGFSEVSGHCNPMPLAAGSDFLLLNWCAIQRIARRSNRLAQDRQDMLTELGFDWTGADALS